MVSLKNILIATDFSEASDAALLYAKNFAQVHAATLHVLHVVDDLGSRGLALGEPMPDTEHLQLQIEARARQKLDTLLSAADRELVRARPVMLTSRETAQSILSYARDAEIDLIVVGTHGRTGFAHFFMGSVAQQVVRAAPCPVLTVRHPEREFVTPDALETVAAHQVPSWHPEPGAGR